MALLQALTGTSPAPTRFELPNGLRVWVQEEHSRPVALVQITYKAGSLNEEPGRTGIAHYVEHMVYRATAHIRNEDIYGYIDRIGGRYTGGTWPEFTRYAETVPSWAVESALRVTAERMCCALFDSTEFERERSNVVTEANGFSDTDPLSAMRDAVMYAAFEAHPYRLNSNTWARDNLVLTRDDAYAWYRSYYGPNNAVLVIVGDVNTDDVRALVERHFARIAPAPRRGEIAVVEPPQRAEKRVRIRAPGVKPQMEIVYHAPSASHPDFPALTVAKRVLEARLRSLPGAKVTVSDSASQYPHVLRIAVTGDSTTDLETVLTTIQGEIDRMRSGVTSAEVAAARVGRPADSVPTPSGSSSGIPPRRSNLTRIADRLTDREALPWEVTDTERDSIRAAAARVDAAQVSAVADRWLRSSQRTVGMLVPGADEFVPVWTDGRPLAGERMEIPPLRTPPAKRLRPEPVPRRALQPLAPLALTTGRRVLSNGIIIRAAQVAGETVAIQVRSDSGSASDSAGHVDLRRAGPHSELGAVTSELARATAARGLPWPITVAVAGPAPPAELISAVAREFSALPRRAALPGRPSTFPRDSIYSVRGRTQVDITAYLPGVPRNHPDRRALELLAYIVGVPSYGGRLGWALTKSGLTYAAAARTRFADRTGVLTFSTEADTRNAPATMQAIREVIAGVGSAGVEEWELEEAKAFTLGRAILFGARDDSPPEVVASALLESEEAGLELLDLPAWSRAWLAVTLDEVNRVARMYYRPERLAMVASGAIPARPETIFPAGTFRRIFEP